MRPMYSTANIEEFAQALSDHRPESIHMNDEATSVPVEYLEGPDGEVAKIIVREQCIGMDATLSNGSTGLLDYLTIALPEPSEDTEEDDGETDEEYRQRADRTGRRSWWSAGIE